MRKYSMILNFAVGYIEGGGGGSPIPMTFIHAHVLQKWGKRVIFYTQVELQRFDFHFFHSAADTRFSLVKKVKPQAIKRNLYETIKEI